MKMIECQLGMTPIEYAFPIGRSLRRNATKNMRKTAMSTGGTPMSRTKGVASPFTHRGERGHAARAPRRFPRMNEKTVATNNSPMVQGSDSRSSCQTVLGNLFMETPRSSRATDPI